MNQTKRKRIKEKSDKENQTEKKRIRQREKQMKEQTKVIEFGSKWIMR